ncbi:stage III sporulation protein AB [Lachnospiraceae bacterium]|jgi:stage III sporulation protein AB|nr:stage III sporulation protein AB [uncultured Schaedlerella sp.]EOS41343.1 stage III sporulation protein AB [Lachnospiraceae bacterium M18-1]MCI9154787.1 stage III sporulation protein AB [Ruminococcus sp.]NBI56620.1 stage III sporulation protein AB [Lachnospiraceae bacterium]
MLRFIGGVLVITATTGAGILYSMELQEYLEKLLYIRHIIYMIKGEMEYSSAPLSEVFGRISVRVREPYRQWLMAMEKQVEEREEDAFLKIWMRSVDKYLKELHLKSEHSIQLKELGTYLGQTDGASESRNLQLYLGRLELEIEKVREGMAAKKRIGNCLGVMGGIFLVVLLI